MSENYFFSTTTHINHISHTSKSVPYITNHHTGKYMQMQTRNTKNTLIINHLHPTPPATTGKKPAKPEMNNKPNMLRYDHEIPADRSKNAQSLMVPFYGVVASEKKDYITFKP